MAISVLVLGESGTGKSASLRNFRKEEVGILNVASKPLPFQNNNGLLIKNFDTVRSARVENALLQIASKPTPKSIVIDDSQYLMSYEFMERTPEKGFDKFTQIGYGFWELIKAANQMPADRIVYFLHHTQTKENGTIAAKTIGKILDEKITLEGMFVIVLRTAVDNGKYYFRTKNSGDDTVKTPMGMFENELIDNDLAAVDKTIRDYYKLNENGADEK